MAREFVFHPDVLKVYTFLNLQRQYCDKNKAQNVWWCLKEFRYALHYFYADQSVECYFPLYHIEQPRYDKNELL